MYSEGLGISRRLFHNETPPHSVADSHKTMPSAAPVLTYARQPTSASMRLPAGACDSHVHVFGPPERFPYSPQSVLRPATASKETLFALHRHLGIERSLCHIGYFSEETLDKVKQWALKQLIERSNYGKPDKT